MASIHTLPVAGGDRSSKRPTIRSCRRTVVTMATVAPLLLMVFTISAAGLAVLQSPFFSPQSSSLFGLSQQVIFEVVDVEYKEGHTGGRRGTGNWIVGASQAQRKVASLSLLSVQVE